MDGVGSTYESYRGRCFKQFRGQLRKIRRMAPIGINYVVNARTIQDLGAAVELAMGEGVAELLLLPERSVVGHGGIRSDIMSELRHWVDCYRGAIPLCISEDSSQGVPTCQPFPSEIGLRAYAHIDASGVVKRSSFDLYGVKLQGEGVMSALEQLGLRCDN